MVRRKQLDIWGVLVPALNMVGEACVNHFSLMRLYVSMAESMSRRWMPSATRISICCGRSTTWGEREGQRGEGRVVSGEREGAGEGAREGAGENE